MKLKAAILLFVFFLCNKILIAQQPLFNNLDVAQGLPGSEVYSVFSDSKGYIWIGTDAGVSRYDGYQFENFDIYNGLPENSVYEIKEDTKGRIWFKCRNTFSFFYKDSIYPLEINSFIKEKLNIGMLNSFYTDKNQVLYFSILNGIVCKAFPPYHKEQVSMSKLPADKGNYIKVIHNKGLVWGTAESGESGLEVLSDKDSITFNIPIDNKKFVHECAIKLHSGELLFSNQTLSKIAGNKITTCHIPYTDLILSLFEDKEYNIWIGTKTGVYCVEKGNFDTPVIHHYLNSERISCITQDFEGGLWFSSLHSGIFHLQTKDIISYKKGDGILTHDVNVLLKNGDNLILGTNNGIDLLKNGKIKTALPGKNTLYFLVQQWHKIYSSFDSKVLVSDSDFKHNSVFYNGFVKAISFSNNNSVWLGNELMIKRITLTDKKELLHLKTGFKLTCLFEDKKERLWIGSLDGLRYFDGKNIRYYGKNDIFKTKIADIKEDSKGTIWIASKERGVLKIDPDNRIGVFNKQTGLTSNICKKLFIDKKSNVWIATNNGLNCIEHMSGKVSNFTVSCGLLSNDIQNLLVVNDTAYIATSKGLSFISVNKKQNANPPFIYITSVVINNKPASEKQVVNLSYSENSITINYKGISFKNTPPTYKYCLSGIDNNWVFTKNISVQYPALNPGNYIFKVYAINASGIASKTAAEIHFCIAPPFWKTTAFILFIGIIVIAATCLIVYMQIRRIKRRNATENKALSNQLKALQSQMNPHFIFNCLNSIQLYIINNESIKSQKFLSKFAKLIRYVLEHSSFSLISLEEELKALTLYLELECMRLNNSFEYAFHFSDTIDPNEIKIPSLIIQPYIENAIWHGFDDYTKKWKLALHFTLERNVLKCIIEDNGVGREKSMLKKGINNHKSLGMSVTSERLEIINSINKQPLSLVIHDLYNEDGTASGTSVELYIPIN